MWSLGDYRELAPRLEPCAIALADACEIGPGTRVLDVAAGNGNFAIAAARRGATVTASDLSPRMIELGRNRAAADGLRIEWVEANAEALPFATEQFDLAASVFGAMFAPRVDRVAGELFRVTHPGGVVAMANYSPTGFLAALAELLESLRPPDGVEFPSPFLWGDPDHVGRRFEGLAASVRTSSQRAAFEFASTDEGWAFWERTNAPQAALKAMMPPAAYAELAERERALMTRMNRAEAPGLRLEWDWLLVVARKHPHPALPLRGREISPGPAAS